MSWKRWTLLVAIAGCAPTFPDITDGPRCTDDGTTLECSSVSVTFWSGIASASPRKVHYMTPEGAAPAAGWPTAILFQGSFHSAADMWKATRGDDFGGYNQTLLVQSLLDHGYAVLTPETRLRGDTYWDTNVLPWAYVWDSSEDHDLMQQIFGAIDAQSFGLLDPTAMFAAGISSGGYMTSRMAIQYADRFHALAIESASYATCAGALCSIPDDLPADHPPTLFLHGHADDIVPIGTAQAYHDKLEAIGVPVRFVTDRAAGHQWIDAAPDAIQAFFDGYR